MSGGIPFSVSITHTWGQIFLCMIRWMSLNILISSLQLFNGMMTNKGIYQMPIMNGETTGQYGLPVATCGASRYALSDKSSFGGSFGIVQITI